MMLLSILRSGNSLVKNRTRSLAVIVLSLLVTGCGSNCKVLDPDIGGTYSGECKEGLAEGQGKASGRDNFEGTFRAGQPHGFGTYKWGMDSDWPTEIYSGNFENGERTGLGEYSADENSSGAYLSWLKTNGKLENGRYIVRGLWYKGELLENCAEQAECFTKFVDNNNLAPKSTTQNETILTKEKLFSLIRDSLDKSEETGKHIPDELQDKILDCLTNHIIAKLPSADGENYAIDARSSAIVSSMESELPSVLTTCLSDTAFPEVDFKTLLVDFNEMIGKRVKVSGIGLYMMDSFIIQSAPMNPNPLQVGINEIDRDTKLALINRCSEEMCQVTVYGVVGKVNYQNGIIAFRVNID